MSDYLDPMTWTAADDLRYDIALEYEELRAELAARFAEIARRKG